jgi:hypothetical protein
MLPSVLPPTTASDLIETNQYLWINFNTHYVKLIKDIIARFQKNRSVKYT